MISNYLINHVSVLNPIFFFCFHRMLNFLFYTDRKDVFSRVWYKISSIAVLILIIPLMFLAEFKTYHKKFQNFQSMKWVVSRHLKFSKKNTSSNFFLFWKKFLWKFRVNLCCGSYPTLLFLLRTLPLKFTHCLFKVTFQWEHWMLLLLIFS